MTDYTSNISGYNVTNTIKPVTEYELKTNTGEVIKKPINYILVLDKSGSMNFSVDREWEPDYGFSYREDNSRIENAETAVKDFVNALFASSTTADDTTVTVVTFANSASYYNKYTKTNYANQIDNFYITAGGGTNIEAGLSKATQYLSSTVQNAIILLSDGTPTEGRRQSATALGNYADAIEASYSNTSIYTIAFGITADENVLKAIATGGEVLASNSATGLIENLNEVQDKLTPGESHYTTNGRIETLYKGTTPLKKFSFIAKHKTDSTQDINQLYDSTNMTTGTNGVFTYTTSTNSDGETEYTLSLDFSQYLNNYKDFEVTYFVNNTPTLRTNGLLAQLKSVMKNEGAGEILASKISSMDTKDIDNEVETLVSAEDENSQKDENTLNKETETDNNNEITDNDDVENAAEEEETVEENTTAETDNTTTTIKDDKTNETEENILVEDSNVIEESE